MNIVLCLCLNLYWLEDRAKPKPSEVNTQDLKNLKGNNSIQHRYYSYDVGHKGLWLTNTFIKLCSHQYVLSERPLCGVNLYCFSNSWGVSTNATQSTNRFNDFDRYLWKSCEISMSIDSYLTSTNWLILSLNLSCCSPWVSLNFLLKLILCLKSLRRTWMEMKLELQELAYVGQLGTEGTGADKDGGMIIL